MTAAIIAFPTYAERDSMEFERFATSSYTRAIDEAATLLPAAFIASRSASDRAQLALRSEALTRLIDRLATGRPELVKNFVLLDCGARVELRAVPPMLKSLLS